MLTNELKRLSNAEKLLLINELWEDVAASEADRPLSVEEEKMLDARYAAFLADPAQGKPWAAVKQALEEQR